MGLPCSLEEIIDLMPYVSKMSLIRMNRFRVELLSTHFYPEHLKQLEKMGWIIADSISLVKYHQTSTEPEQKLLRVRLETKHWNKSNHLRYEIRGKNHDILSIVDHDVRGIIQKLRHETQPFYAGD